jgi:diguanylate cyclase (GGDEF)-like protein
MSVRQAFNPGFRNRLRLFFALIVIVPMIAVALVLFQLVDQSNRNEVDARLSQAQRTALAVYEDDRKDALQEADRIGREAELAAALESGDEQAIQRRLDALALRRVRYVDLELPDGRRIEAGRLPAVAKARALLMAADETTGELTVSVSSAEHYAETVARLSGAEVVVHEDGAPIATTMPDAARARLPNKGEAEIAGSDYRVTSFTAPVGGRMRVWLVLPDADPVSLVSKEALMVLGLLLGFLALAFAFAATVSRTLHQETNRLLVAARRLGEGDFSVAVPAEGNDEFAALGQEFNSMARQLEARLDEVQHERKRWRDAIRRVGEAFAKGLDREGLLGVVVQTAVDGVGAAGGRAKLRTVTGEPLDDVARAGSLEGFGPALHAAEVAALDVGRIAEIQLVDVSALAAPIGSTETRDHTIGTLAVARNDRAFTQAERDLFAYLTNQASVSVVNVDLHETVQRQAVTDELTGLFNHRRFQEVMSTEVERARRYGHELGLIMLDIDNFKEVNDTYGHLQGDMVLREVARILRQESREIDEPARYGGEEMAVALPQTDLEGAYQFAERVRKRIERIELALPGGRGRVKVTASFGVASLTAAGDTDKDALVWAADQALYAAKRAGKNRTVRATSGAPNVHGVASTE